MSDMELRLGYFKPDIEEIPNDWEPVRIGDFCDIFQGGMSKVTKEKDYQNSGVPAFSAAGQDGFVSEAEFKNKEGVILSSIGAYCGKTFFAEGDWTTLANIQAIIPRSRIDPKFLYYRTNASKYWLRSGSAQPFISPKSVFKSWVAAPCLSEQKKIVEILTTVDRQIEKTEALIAKYEYINVGLMEVLCWRGVDSNKRIRPSPEEMPSLYKESHIGLIPASWELKSLDDVTYKVTSGSRGWAQFYSEFGAVFIRVSNLTRNHINLSWKPIAYVQPPKSFEAKRTSVMEGDVLISITADLGITAVVPSGMGEAYINQHIAASRPNNQIVNSGWIARFLSTERGQKQFSKHNDQGAKAGLNLPTIRSLLLPIPPLEEQNEIELILNKIENIIHEEALRISKLKKIRNGLMQDLLTGKVRVSLDEVEEAVANA